MVDIVDDIVPDYTDDEETNSTQQAFLQSSYYPSGSMTLPLKSSHKVQTKSTSQVCGGLVSHYIGPLHVVNVILNVSPNDYHQTFSELLAIRPTGYVVLPTI